MGFKYSSGDFITFFAGDDVMFSNSLEKRLIFSEKYDYVFCNFIETNKDLVPIKRVLSSKRDKLYNWKKYYKRIIFSNFVPGGSFLIKKELLDKIMPIPETLSFEDWWVSFWGGVYNKSIFYISEPLIFYRIHENNSHGKASNIPFDTYYKEDIKRHFSFYLELLSRLNKLGNININRLKLIKLIFLNYEFKFKVINEKLVTPKKELIINYGLLRIIKLNIVSKNLISKFYSIFRRFQ